jgi:hypothetical protein
MFDLTGNNVATNRGAQLNSVRRGSENSSVDTRPVRLVIAAESCVAVACVGALVAEILIVTSLVESWSIFGSGLLCST